MEIVVDAHTFFSTIYPKKKEKTLATNKNNKTKNYRFISPHAPHFAYMIFFPPPARLIFESRM
jgi:hypothetical protein